MKLYLRLGVAMVAWLAVASCGAPPRDERVQAQYDKQTGRLSQLTVDAGKDGKPNITSYMEGTKFLRIEIDTNEDGSIDRWEYYRPDQKLEKVGFSRSNDGVVDSWAFQGVDGLVAKVEVSKKRDGKIDRTEYYEKGELARAEEDTNGDGRVDKWETYANGGISAVSFDIDFNGTSDQTIDYTK